MSELPERMAKIEAVLPHLATKADLAKMDSVIKNWMLTFFATQAATLIALILTVLYK